LLAAVPHLPGEEAHASRMREVLFLGMSGPLAVILDRQERMSMASGLEVRFPFCDHRLVQYLWNVPWSMKSRGGTKRLLKDAMADLLPRGRCGAARAPTRTCTTRVRQGPRRAGRLDRQRPGVGHPVDVRPGAGGRAARRDPGRPAPLRPARRHQRPQLLIQIVEAHAWIEDHDITV